MNLLDAAALFSVKWLQCYISRSKTHSERPLTMFSFPPLETQ